MHYDLVRQFAFSLRNLDAMLEKTIGHATNKGFDPNNFVTARLAPDMMPFSRQVQIACDIAKSTAAALSGTTAPRFEDHEKTIGELQQRIRATIEYVESFDAAALSKVTAASVVPVPYPPGKAMHGKEYVFTRQIPNFYFHVTTAYALLRAGGVDLGKMDYLGAIVLFDA